MAHKGVADPPDDLRRKPRTVVGDLDRDFIPRPPQGHINLFCREIDRVLGQVSQTVNHLGPTMNRRLALGTAGAGRNIVDNRTAALRVLTEVRKAAVRRGKRSDLDATVSG